jgi:hypothetical protein
MKISLLVSVLCCMFLVHPSQAGETSNVFSGGSVPNAFGRGGAVLLVEDHAEVDSASSFYSHATRSLSSLLTDRKVLLDLRGGGLFLPAGYHPFGYKITPLGEQFLEIHKNCLESDVGRFIASLKNKRKTFSTLQQEWLEIVRVSKSGQIMRIYRTMKDMIEFCIAARLID